MKTIVSFAILLISVAASLAQEATAAEILAMQAIGKRVETFMQRVKVTETKVRVPAKPAGNGGYQIIVISSKPYAAPSGDKVPAEHEVRMGWMLFAMGATAVFTKDSPRPITSMAFAGTNSLKEGVCYVLDMALARDLQQKLKADEMGADAAYERIKAALKRTEMSAPAP